MAELKVKTQNFDAATIGGHRVGVGRGRLMVRTHGEDARYSWDASGAFEGVMPSLNRMGEDDAVDVQFEMVHGAHCSGKAFVEVSVSVTPSGATSLLRLHGTGDLVGWDG